MISLLIKRVREIQPVLPPTSQEQQKEQLCILIEVTDKVVVQEHLELHTQEDLVVNTLMVLVLLEEVIKPGNHSLCVSIVGAEDILRNNIIRVLDILQISSLRGSQMCMLIRLLLQKKMEMIHVNQVLVQDFSPQINTNRDYNCSPSLEVTRQESPLQQYHCCKCRQFSPTLSYSNSFSSKWIIDTRAFHHITSNMNLIDKAKKTLLHTDNRVHLSNGKDVSVSHVGKSYVFTDKSSLIFFLSLSSNVTC